MDSKQTLIYIKNKLILLNNLKLIYSIFYIILCFIIASIYLFKYASSYTKLIDLTKINIQNLLVLAEIRGIQGAEQNEINNLTNNRNQLESLILNAGSVNEAELENANLTNKSEPSKIFKNGDEFLESVEDSRDSIWLVNIITKPKLAKTNDNSTCNRSKFLKMSTWNKLNSLSKQGILTGTFYCENDPHFCELKGWNKSKLALGIVKYNPKRYPKEFVELVYYDNCNLNKFEHVFSWVESTIRNKLIKTLDFNKNLITSNRNTEEDKNMLKIFYVENSKKLPLFYSGLSIKHNKRTSFYLVKSYETYSTNDKLTKIEQQFVSLCIKDTNGFRYDLDKANTRVFILVDDKICYNYGTNLNELPNYTNLNNFLLFLSPDINNIFLVTLILLNIYLVMLVFDYKKSFLNQIGRGLFYLCIFNSILFSIWLLTINANSKSTLTSFPNLYLNKFLTWYRILIMHNQLSQSFFSKLRFFLFFYLYIKPTLAFLIYFLVCLMYYIHKRCIYIKNLDKFEKKLKLNKKLNSINISDNLKSASDSSLLPLKNSTKANNLAQKKNNKQNLESKKSEINNNNTNNQTNQINSSITSTATSIEVNYMGDNDRQAQSTVSEPANSIFNQNPIDIDVEIGVYELINQINGLTTIWLQSTTHADRLISELPSIEFCKCFYEHTIKVKALDETDRDETTTEDDEELIGGKKFGDGMSNGCECGKNKDLKNYLVDKNKFRRECSICLEKYKFGSLIVFLPCGHLFHRKCIYEWFMNSVNYDLKCPVCRTSFYKFKKTL